MVASAAANWTSSITEKNRKELEELLKIPGNDSCADCGVKDVEKIDWASSSLGCFLCIDCSGIHRNLGTHISKVKSIRLDTWTDDMVNVMASIGNTKCNAFYEKYVAASIKRPSPLDSYVLREQWVRAKYERREFVSKNELYLTGTKEGFLTKKGKVNQKWLKRFFVLSEGKLSYYKKQSDLQYKESFDILDINIAVADEKTGKPYSLQISVHGRNYFVYAENGKSMFDWLMSIRGAKYILLKDTLLDQPKEVVNKALSQDVIIEGWLKKLGGVRTWKLRWYSLFGNTLYYYVEPLDAFATEEITLSAETLVQAAPTRYPDKGACLTIYTPESNRTYEILAANSDEMTAWVHALHNVVDNAASSRC